VHRWAVDCEGEWKRYGRAVSDTGWQRGGMAVSLGKLFAMKTANGAEHRPMARVRKTRNIKSVPVDPLHVWRPYGIKRKPINRETIEERRALSRHDVCTTDAGGMIVLVSE